MFRVAHAGRVVGHSPILARTYSFSRIASGIVSDWVSSSGARVPFPVLSQTFEAIQALPGRNSSIALLSSLYSLVNAFSPSELPDVAQFSCGTLCPVHRNRELSVGPTALLSATQAVSGLTEAVVTEKLRSTGDFGDTFVALCHDPQRPPRAQLLLQDVKQGMWALAETEGKGSAARRQAIIQGLMQSCQHAHEYRFLARLLSGTGLRIGVSEKSVLAALAQCFQSTAPPTSDELMRLAGLLDMAISDCVDTAPGGSVDNALLEQLQTAYYCAPDFSTLIGRLQSLEGSLAPAVEVGIPVIAMLGVAAPSIDEVVKMITQRGGVSCEWKYDGERVQVHVDVGRGIAKCFSRAGEDSSFKYAEVSTSVQAAMAPDVTSVVLEGEAVAVDRNTGSILPFSAVASLSRGEKRRGAAGSATASPAPDGETSADTSVCLFVFDVLALNGKSVFQESLQARKALLQRSLVLIPGKYELARSTDLVISKDGLVTVTSTYVDDVRYIPIEELGREVGALMTAAVEGKCEGLMVKTLSGDGSVYLPGSRTKAWLKLKSDYEGMAGGDAMDVVPIGGWRGKGKRKGLIGSFLVATYDPNSGKFSSLTKLGTGFTEADLETLSTCLDTVEGKPEDVTSTVVPDVWFKPAVVWEIRAAELSLSPSYTAGAGYVQSGVLAGKHVGIGARFPRFLRPRPDKRPTEATTDKQIAEAYQSHQSRRCVDPKQLK